MNGDIPASPRAKQSWVETDSLKTRRNVFEGGTDREQPGWSQKIFPGGFTQEFHKLFSLTWPTAFAEVLFASMNLISVMFCGHLGREKLDGVGLAFSVLNVSGLSICMGFTTACDTFFSQAFGSENKFLVGIYLQRSLLMVVLLVCMSWTIHLNTEALLIRLGQNPRIARVAGQYLLYNMPGFLFCAIYLVLTRYLRNQSYVRSAFFLGAFGNVVNVIAQYLAVFVLKKDVEGSAIGLSVSFFILLLTTTFYILFAGIHRDTWSGWTWRAFEHWGPFARLAVAGMLMMAIEWWTFEIGIFLSGLLGQVELGTMTVVFNTEEMFYMITCGVGAASSIRVGHSLGSRDLVGAVTASRVTLVLAGINFVFSAVVLLSTSRLIPLLFTKDPYVTEMASRTMPVLALLAFQDTFATACAGILRGCGRQFLVTVCNVFAYFVIALPTSALLMFIVRIGVIERFWNLDLNQSSYVESALAYLRFWWGVITGTLPLVALFILIVTTKIDWEREVAMACSRTSEQPTHATRENDPLLKAGMTDSIQTTSGKKGNKRLERVNLEFCWKICEKLVIIVGVLAILLTGVCVRLFVPLPCDDEPLQFNTSTLLKRTLSVSGH